MIKILISRFTMKKTGKSFRDIVDGKKVFYFKDKHGQEFMANHRFSVRVKVEKETDSQK